jgi:hypothetical protein
MLNVQSNTNDLVSLTFYEAAGDVFPSASILLTVGSLLTPPLTHSE